VKKESVSVRLGLGLAYVSGERRGLRIRSSALETNPVGTLNSLNLLTISSIAEKQWDVGESSEINSYVNRM
jgi:hypothetical protein